MFYEVVAFQAQLLVVAVNETLLKRGWVMYIHLDQTCFVVCAAVAHHVLCSCPTGSGRDPSQRVQERDSVNKQQTNRYVLCS